MKTLRFAPVALLVLLAVTPAFAQWFTPWTTNRLSGAAVYLPWSNVPPAPLAMLAPKPEVELHGIALSVRADATQADALLVRVTYRTAAGELRERTQVGLPNVGRGWYIVFITGKGSVPVGPPDITEIHWKDEPHLSLTGTFLQ